MNQNGLGLHLVFTGAPGCGKGTQARRLKEKIAIPHLTTGEMLRAEAAKGTPLGLEIKALIDGGNLVPDEMIIKMLSARIDEDDCKNGFILDGFPRTVPQAEALDAMGVKIDKVIEIYVPDETIQQRLSGRRVCLDCGATYHTAFKPSKVEGVCDVCGKPIVIRKDDEPATVISRLQTYHKSTAPLKDYYGKQGKLVTVEGQDKVEDTSKLVLEAVKA